MTAEVAVMNKQAVALAADSAVTIQWPDGTIKIFETIKLFTLSKYRPVGILVYSSADIMGVPVETAIKVFREKLSNDSYPTLDGYYSCFQDFLKNDAMFSEGSRIEHCGRLINTNLARLRGRIGREIARRYPGWSKTKAQVKTVARELLTDHAQKYRNSSNLLGVTGNIRRRVRSRLDGPISAWQDIYQEFFFLADSDAKIIAQLCLDLILKDNESGSETGFVIAGFGEDDYFPKLRSFEIEASIFNVHKIRELENVDMRTSRAKVIPFAQKEMVETFRDGRASNLDEELVDFIDKFFESEKQIIARPPTDPEVASMIQTFYDVTNQKLQTEFRARLKKFTEDNHTYPVERTVEAMPKEELARMAQALVDLTTIKRRSTPDAETVGGPTDVAVISKGDGMIWINRKHYFDSNMNLGFTTNYYRQGP
jgi:hypothetical protein